MYLVKVVTIFALFVTLFEYGNADPVPRLTGGQQVDNLRQFPHHVYIIPFYPFQSWHKCAGSILNAQWVLTSAPCIDHSVRLELHFGKKNEYDDAGGYFSVSVNRDQVYQYPNNFDDIALIRLPLRLVFSDTIMPVNISRLSIEGLRDKFAVMPGFIEKALQTTTPGLGPAFDDNLKYGMFNVLDNTICKQKLGSDMYFDEYNQLCTESWGANRDTPCDSDFGSGLIIGWPANSELIGMFSMFSASCNGYRPSIFTYVAKYLPWIESMIQG